MKKVLMIYPYETSFVRGDIQQLEKIYHLTTFKADWRSKGMLPVNLVRQFFFLLFNFKKFDACIVQFGGYWSYFPTLLGKLFRTPTFIVLHGSDCAAMPSLSYGNLRKNPLRWFIRKSLKNATELWPVSKSLVENKNSYFEFNSPKEKFQGYKAILGPINTPYFVIPNGFDFQFWQYKKTPKIDHTFLAVISGESQYKLKGIDLIIEVAQLLPDYQFNIVGMQKPLSLITSSNVQFLGRLTQQQLSEVYNSHQFYLQLSISEGFGMALCEAMLHGCIPIVSNVNILPEIIGNAGFVLHKKDANELCHLIAQILAEPTDQLHHIASQTIFEKYNIINRIQLIQDRLEHYFEKH